MQPPLNTFPPPEEKNLEAKPFPHRVNMFYIETIDIVIDVFCRNILKKILLINMNFNQVPNAKKGLIKMAQSHQ